MSANTSKNYLYTHLHLPRIGQSCKASLAEYRSPLLRTMETLTYSPALLTGLSSQKQLLNINFFVVWYISYVIAPPYSNYEIHMS